MATASQRWVSLPYKARANDEKSPIFQRDLVIDEISSPSGSALASQPFISKRLKIRRVSQESRKMARASQYSG
jgi:hypothetical protein